MINVTKTYLPPFEEYTAFLNRAWKNEWLTNRGELVVELERRISSYLGLNESKLICMNNGTIPIQIALKLLARGGEVITTPFSYVATTAAIVWEKCTPVFVDVDPLYLTIDESKIEQAITPNTTCILATHVFGNPCNVDELERIAKKHQLKVIYDAAHCFGVNYKGRSIFEYGDVSTCSFHATKLFHTGEGGAVFCSDDELFHKMYYSHNFGHNGPLQFHGLGINAKISEIQAAMGLAVLNHVKEIIEQRRFVAEWYELFLGKKSGITRLSIRPGTEWNYSYYPIIFESEEKLLATEQRLLENEVRPRRYFYPSLNNLPYVEQVSMLNSDSIVRRVLCLPMFAGLKKEDVEKICACIN